MGSSPSQGGALRLRKSISAYEGEKRQGRKIDFKPFLFCRILFFMTTKEENNDDIVQDIFSAIALRRREETR
jgi:hypothetical protein